MDKYYLGSVGKDQARSTAYLVYSNWSAYNDISTMLTFSSDKVWMVVIIVYV